MYVLRMNESTYISLYSCMFGCICSSCINKILLAHKQVGENKQVPIIVMRTESDLSVRRSLDNSCQEKNSFKAINLHTLTE